MECYVDTAGNTYDFGFGLNRELLMTDKNIGGKAAIALNFYERYCMPVMEYSGTTWRGLQEYHRFWLSEA